jgi:hypothetical protein
VLERQRISDLLGLVSDGRHVVVGARNVINGGHLAVETSFDELEGCNFSATRRGADAVCCALLCGVAWVTNQPG